MQILELLLYSHDGRRRAIQFRVGSLNVITGESRSGKSAIVEIIRFCLGSTELRVPAGIISEAVAWFGLRLQLPAGEAFVGRPVPPVGQATTSAAMLRLGATVPAPEPADLAVNTNTEAVIATLGVAIGIAENEASLPASASRLAVEATLAHGLFFCFQRQDEIANRELLFHRQAEPYISTHIRDVLPYFLGAVPADYVVLQGRLRTAREDLRRAEARRDQFRGLRDNQQDESTVLLREAQQVGLIDSRPLDEQSPDTLTRWLREVLDSMTVPAELGLSSGQALIELRTQQADLAGRYRELQQTHRLVESILHEQSGYLEELAIQTERMEAVELLPAGDDPHVCPICASPLREDLPTVAELRAALAELRQGLDSVGRDNPRLQRRLAQVEVAQSDLRGHLAETNTAVDALVRQAEELERLGDRLNAESYVRGRIDHYMQTLEAADVRALEEAERLVEEQARVVRTLEELLSFDTVRDNVTSILNVVGEDMRAGATRLELEYANTSVRIDARRLTVVADTSTGIVPLARMGSASNWVGYHLVSYVALQKFFVENARPVPRFVVFDQPTQAYYPPDLSDEDILSMGDADRRAVDGLFAYLRDVTAALTPGLQVIVLDHAKLDRDWFTAAIVEEWRGGLKLVPADWELSSGSSSP